MTEDDDNDSQAHTGGDITRYRAHVARIRCRYVGAMAKPSARDMERVKRIGRYLARKPRAKCWCRWQQSGELEGYSDADWGGDKATRRSVSAGVIVGGGHCLKAWTKKQQVVVAVFRRERAVRRSQNCVRRARNPESGNGLGNIMWTEPPPGCLSDDVHGQL